MSACSKARYIWMDGELIECERAYVHILTHALHYGTAVFEGIRGYWSEDERNLYIFRLRDHMVRMINSARIVGLRLSYGIEDLVNAVIRTVKVNEFQENIYIRPIAFAGEGSISLDTSKVPTRVSIAAFPFGHYLKPKGVRVKVVSWRRVPNYSMPVIAKASGIYLNSVIALSEALSSGYDEAILLDWRGYVSEGSGENIFVVKRGVIYTPPTYASILEGITRDSVIKISRELGYEVVERDIAREELYTADEIFMSGTAAEITPVVEVDGRVIGIGSPGPITEKIMEYYKKIVYNRVPRYREWITPVY
ncbi:MAG: branched-chain amino acid transaminase [Desulfurococcales archaeon]|jgi:branched-chain amino acid aminotransferase|nr:branched-chain amino acid transaminase [Desulfurococcales archaeon]